MGQTPGCRLDEPQEEESQEVAASAHPEPVGADVTACRGSAAEGRRRVGTDHAATCRGTNGAASRRAATGESDAAGGAKHAATGRAAHDRDADGVAAATITATIAPTPGYVALGAAPRSA